jgi:hypothetical protein
MFLAGMALHGATGMVATPDCRVLSMSGGGSFGAFESGVLSRMVEEEPGLDYDFMLGVSAGALNVGFLSTSAPGAAGLNSTVHDLKNLWETTRSDDVWSLRLDPFGSDPSILSSKPLEKTLEMVLAGRQVQRQVTIGTTNLATGATARHDEDQLARQTSTLLRASSAIPLAFPPITVNETRHVDGGNSANVLTIHGIDRCDLKAKMSGKKTPPTIQLDVILAEQTIEQVTPDETTSWNFLELAAREFVIAKKQLFDHQLRFQCAAGVSSRIHMTLRTPNSVIEKGSMAILNFDKGPEIWGIGYNKSRVNVTSFDFCL